jgi:hypothetical protein
MGKLGVARSEPARAHPMGVVPVVIESRDAHAFARLSRVDKLPVADVNPVVAKTVEEDEVPRLQVVLGYRSAVLVLLDGIVRQRDTDPTVDVPDEARAVEAAWTRSAPPIRSADMFQGNLDDLAAAPVPLDARRSPLGRRQRRARRGLHSRTPCDSHGQAQHEDHPNARLDAEASEANIGALSAPSGPPPRDTPRLCSAGRPERSERRMPFHIERQGPLGKRPRMRESTPLH